MCDCGCMEWGAAQPGNRPSWLGQAATAKAGALARATASCRYACHQAWRHGDELHQALLRLLRPRHRCCCCCRCRPCIRPGGHHLHRHHQRIRHTAAGQLPRVQRLGQRRVYQHSAGHHGQGGPVPAPARRPPAADRPRCACWAQALRNRGTPYGWAGTRLLRSVRGCGSRGLWAVPGPRHCPPAEAPPAAGGRHAASRRRVHTPFTLQGFAARRKGQAGSMREQVDAQRHARREGGTPHGRVGQGQ
mmetsp:Transcript_29084/g.64237  ORF Transcript_29084/g.64237 Transcript_29084/m.64237 type:complete len:247 (+) Transcript_29084:797-1537(+)